MNIAELALKHLAVRKDASYIFEGHGIANVSCTENEGPRLFEIIFSDNGGVCNFQ